MRKKCKTLIQKKHQPKICLRDFFYLAREKNSILRKLLKLSAQCLNILCGCMPKDSMKMPKTDKEEQATIFPNLDLTKK